jgi:(1->4)-alpha-D-glucan 1-alpha-D-glucosylmutase
VNAPYEEAVQRFVRATLDRRGSRPFLDRLARFSARIAPAARLNTLGTLTLKATTPGVPDFYQGSELLLTTLTDPDNRGRVDFAALAARAQHGENHWEAGAETGDAKFALTRAVLALRSRHPELFNRGRYVPAEVDGALAEHVFAFTREWRKEYVLVVVPRLTARLPHAGGMVTPSAWEDTAVSAPGAVGEWRNVLTGHEVPGGVSLSVSDLLRSTPVGVFEGRTN